MAKTYEELLEQAAIVRDETAEGKNTASRVGGAIADIVEYLENSPLAKDYTPDIAALKAKDAALEAKDAELLGTIDRINRSLNENDQRQLEKIGANIADIAALKAKDAALEAKDAELVAKNERQDNHISYCERNIYKLNEDAGSLAFHGSYAGNAAISTDRKTDAEDQHTYQVVKKGNDFYLKDIYPGGGTVMLYEEWDALCGVASSESYARTDIMFCLPAEYSDDKMAHYYYKVVSESGFELRESAATYLLRRLVDAQAKEVKSLKADADAGVARNLSLTDNKTLRLINGQGGKIGAAATLQDKSNLYEGSAGPTTVQLVMAKALGGTAEAILGAATTARAGVMTVAHVNKISKLEERVMQYLYPKIYQINEGAGAIKFDGFTEEDADIAFSGVPGNITSYEVLYSTSGKKFVLKVTFRLNGETRPTIRYYVSWEKIVDGDTKIASSESYKQRDCLYYIFVDGVGSTYYYIDSHGEVTENSAATYLLRRLVDKNASSISALQGKNAEQDGEIATLHERDTALDGKISALEAKDIEHNAAITANTQEIARVNSTATRAQEDAERAQKAAETAQATADSASSAAVLAQTAVDNAQSDATAAQTKNTEQDARLEAIENIVSPLSTAGRYWNEANGTPTAAGHYGSLDALRSLPEMLGLGRYLVKDDRTRRKLDPKDSKKYADDGTDAKLDGTDGQCMWCWNGFYANVWKEGDNLFKVVSFERPVGNDISIWIPAGGISWLGAGVIDRGDAPFTDKTKWKLCSIISDPTLDPSLYSPDFKAERYRGGAGTALNPDDYSKAPAAESPQITMLGMPATYISTTEFGNYARKRGLGWEANWFVARFVVEFLFEVIMGTENSQEAFNANKDANGLYQGGFGIGVTDMPDWGNYNGIYPVIPTSVGLDAGDGVCLVEYKLTDASGGTYKTFNVPVFFGLVGAGYGHLYQLVSGLIIDVGEEQSLVYVAQRMADYDPKTVADKILVAECPRVSGWIKRKSYRGLCCIPTEIGGSQNIRYSDFLYESSEKSKGLRGRAAGGRSPLGTQTGASFSYTDSNAMLAYSASSAPLCYFTEDPKIPLSQSIANK